VQLDHPFVVVGRATSSTILDMALVRYTAEGTLETSSDGGGANGSETELALLRANP
jgi:hypothetical protein